MQDRLPGGLALQDADLASSAARPKRATVHRVQDRELDVPKCVASFRSSSLGPRAGPPCRLGSLRASRPSFPGAKQETHRS